MTALLVALIAAAIASGALGFVFERVIVRQVYGAPLRQIADHHRRADGDRAD